MSLLYHQRHLRFFTLWICVVCLCSTNQLQAQDQWLNYTNNHVIFDVVETDEGYWTASSGGLAYYEFSTGNKTFYNRGNSNLPTNTIDDLLIDDNDVLWMTTHSGLCKLKNGQIERGPKIVQGKLRKTLDGKIIVANHKNLYIQKQDMLFDTIEYPNRLSDLGGLEVDQINGAIYINAINELSDTYVAAWNSGQWTYLFSDMIGQSYMTLDLNNRLWLLSEFGLNYYQDSTWILIPETLNIENLRARPLHVNLDNEILFGQPFNCAVLHKWNGIELSEFSFAKDACANCVFIKPSDLHTNLYFATNRNFGLYTFSTNEINAYQPLSQSPLRSNLIKNTLHLSDGSHLIIYSNNIQLIKDGEWSEIPIPVNIKGTMSAGFLDVNDELWLHDDEKLWYYHNNTWHTVNITFPLLDKIALMAVGDNGDVWIQAGTNIARYRDNVWQNFDPSHHGIPYKNIFDIQIDPDNGDLWVTSSEGVDKYNGQNWIRYEEEPLAFADKIDISLEGVYVTTYSGIYFINNENIDLIPYPNQDYFGPGISEILFDEESNKLYLSSKGVLAVYQNNAWAIHTTTNSGIYDSFTNKISIDPDDNVWLAGLGGGVGVFNPEGVLISSTIKSEVSSSFDVKVFPTLLHEDRCFIDTEISAEFDVSIFDMTGRIVLSQELFIHKNQPTAIDLSNISAKLLLVTVSSENHSTTKRIVNIN